MNRWLVLVLIAFGVHGGPALPAAEISLRGHLFSLPDGFTIESVAGPDLVPRPIAGSFDPQGRLFVTDSSGSNLPPSEQLKDPQSRILRLDDTNGDGIFDRSLVFADRVMFPQGCLWHDGSVYVAGPPSIWRFTDTDGDGVADRREEWYQGKVLTGCANDVHGPYLGPEGMLYWTKGAFARLDLRDHRGRPIHDRAAHVFRAWPDGSGLETVMSGGMDNPVEVAFTAEGEPIVISTFIDLSQPGRRDGLAHAIYGGVFGKINDVVEEPMVRRTGGLLPILSQFGPAAACALMRYEGDAFGPEYRDNLLGTLFNLRKVTRHVLRLNGASYASEDSDFLVSDQFDFRPTDVLQDVDGSLLVIDTGGWYKLCCPSSQLAKADVLGGIYRVRRARPPTGPALTTDAQARRAAYARLVQFPRLREGSPQVTLKRAALKAEPSSATTFRQALAANIDRASENPEAAHLVRIAAEGLGRIQDSSSVPTLMAALDLAGTQDRFLEHSLLFALIEIGHADALRPFTDSPNPLSRRAALLALEQIGEHGTLNASDILPVLNAEHAPLRDTARWIARRHAEWGHAFAQHFRHRLNASDASDDEKSAWESLFDLLARAPEGRDFLAEVASQPGYRLATRTAALETMAASGEKNPPASWRLAMISSLRTPTSLPSSTPASTEALRAASLRALRALSVARESDTELVGLLRSVAADEAAPSGLRLDALLALPTGTPVGDAESAFLVASLAPAQPATSRLTAANAAARLRFTPTQLEHLADAVADAGPIELQRLLGAFTPGGDATLGQRLSNALSRSKALRSLRREDIEPALAKFPAETRQAVDALLASRQSDASQDRARLDALLGELQRMEGSIRNGQTLFNSPKAACSSCHRLGYLGGDLGPDLTSIGTIRNERDLLEAVVFPSASFVRSYEPWVIETRDNEEYSGTLRRETPDEVVLATGPGAEVRLARSDILQMRQGMLSTMPAGLDEQLTRQELADLLAFLKNTKWGVN